ncbi:NADH-ubiquinone oxidoreductase-F iron-sulfur binding region domain-containing protein [Nocardioides sp.]|uniref:NADH-ubiquinone oxidoreductase-F iron-sulfur binding region domain-containing protein n=1 Tax=Nocardioides sp. TaxID=35761 RepID=UPI00272701E7|nr:NADH-ubiquinone oxidoreductase-F iron-sulfur binding region domain-containing protein [Nocardioides sp.]MDO9454753.1 NADH-ubiquinone oxidoreductase-F iron-sulfur binding region domain-containing protein [Nocardioides sp.]
MSTTTLGLLAAPPADRLPVLSLPELVAAVEAAGLTGRGGAGFPTTTKLRAAAGARGLVVVANAMEGEPLSSKDAVLLARAPHLVLEGLALVSAALGATRRVVGAGSHLPVAALRPVASAYDVEVVVVPGGFVSGQESALVRGLSGLPAVPTDPLVRVTTRGVDGRPTLVLNAETLASVAMAVRFGPAAAASRLLTISGAVEAPGVVEAPRTALLGDVVDRARPGPLRAVLVGGYHGGWVPAGALGTSLADLAVGAGVLHVLGAGTCPLAATARIATYLAGETAGQCGPCVNALPRVADTLARLASGPPDPRLPAEVARLSALAAGRGACAHPDGTVRMVLSAMQVFADDVAAHLEGRCTA